MPDRFPHFSFWLVLRDALLAPVKWISRIVRKGKPPTAR